MIDRRTTKDRMIRERRTSDFKGGVPVLRTNTPESPCDRHARQCKAMAAKRRVGEVTETGTDERGGL
jgi:hypothetical protein